MHMSIFVSFKSPMLWKESVFQEANLCALSESASVNLWSIPQPQSFTSAKERAPWSPAVVSTPVNLLIYRPFNIFFLLVPVFTPSAAEITGSYGPTYFSVLKTKEWGCLGSYGSSIYFSRKGVQIYISPQTMDKKILF